MERVTIDVSGQRFAINKQTISQGPDSKLKLLCAKGIDDVIVIDRPADVFGAVLALYQTEELHIPVTSCPGAFLKELRYWDIPKDRLAKCCYFRVQRFLKEQATLHSFQEKIRAIHEDRTRDHQPRACRAFSQAREAIWTVVDKRDSSCFTTMYMLVSVVMMLASIYTLALSTDRSFKRPLTNCERLQIMHETNMDGTELIQDILQAYCDDSVIPADQSIDNETDTEGNMFIFVELEQETEELEIQPCSELTDLLPTLNSTPDIEPLFPPLSTHVPTLRSMDRPLTTTSLPVKPPDPPLTTTSLPVKPPDPPLTTTSLPVKPPDPPLTTTSLPVKPPDPPLTTTSLPVKPPDPPLTTTPLPVKPPDPPFPDKPNQPTSNKSSSDLRNSTLSLLPSVLNYTYTPDPFNNVSIRNLNENISKAVMTPEPILDLKPTQLQENLCSPGKPPPGDAVIKRIRIPNLEIPLDMFRIIELIILIYFTLDLVLRLFACPSVIRYFTSVINVTDAMALLGAYVHLVLMTLLPREKHDTVWVVVVQMLQMFRSFRLFRVVIGFNISKVIAFSLVKNCKDLLIMFVYLFAGMCIFSTVIYIVESADTIDSIPSGMYWAVVTMTTVGYGDIVPHTKTGRFIGGVCAVSGVMMFALAVPLVVNHFITLYQYVGLEEPGCLNKEDNLECRNKGDNPRCRNKGDNPVDDVGKRSDMGNTTCCTIKRCGSSNREIDIV